MTFALIFAGGKGYGIGVGSKPETILRTIW